MEIYTGVIERMRGQALATNRWDRLLSKGWRLYGHATDDQHESADHFIAWNCVQWPFEEPPEAQGIVTALAQGRFYASTGVAIGLIAAVDNGNSIVIESDADEVHWITSDSVILKKERSGNSTFSLDEFSGVPKRLPQRLDQLAPRQVARELHIAITTSSRTRCRRTRLGGVESK